MKPEIFPKRDRIRGTKFIWLHDWSYPSSKIPIKGQLYTYVHSYAGDILVKL